MWRMSPNGTCSVLYMIAPTGLMRLRYRAVRTAHSGYIDRLQMVSQMLPEARMNKCNSVPEMTAEWQTDQRYELVYVRTERKSSEVM